MPEAEQHSNEDESSIAPRPTGEDPASWAHGGDDPKTSVDLAWAMANAEDTARVMKADARNRLAKMEEQAPVGSRTEHQAAVIDRTRAQVDLYESQANEAGERRKAEYLAEQAQLAAEAHAEQSEVERRQHRMEAMPWDIPEQAATPEARRIIRESYENLLKAEAREPQDDDVYRVPWGLKPESVEYAALAAQGVPAERLESGNITRAEAKAAGYYFANRLGGGEKGILSGDFVDEATGETLNYGDRAFLTREELQKAWDAQQKAGEGLRGQDVARVRADEMLFLLSMKSPSPYNGPEELYDAVIPPTADDPAWTAGTIEERQLVIDRFGALGKANGYTSDVILIAKPGEVHFNRERMTHRQGLSAAGTTLVGRDGVFGASVGDRVHKLRSSRVTYSPFLDSGFIFGDNPDVMVQVSGKEKGKQLQRLNMVSIHLAGGVHDPKTGEQAFLGLSESGAQGWDQRYMSTGTYVEKFYRAPDTRETVAAAEEYGALTPRERTLAEDLAYLDDDVVYNEVVRRGQQNLLARASKVPQSSGGPSWV